MPFLKTVVYGGIFFGVYICFEFINKVFNIFPLFSSLINDYVAVSKQSSLSEYADPEKFTLLSAIRPFGLEINFTAGGFFLASVFFILLFSAHRFIRSYFFQLLAMLVTYIGVIFSSSRQNIFLLHLLLIGLIFVILVKKRIFEKETVRSIRNNLLLILAFICLGIVFLFTLDTTVYSDFLTGKSGGTTEIISNDLTRLVDNQLLYLSTYPFNFFFGIGYYTPTFPGLYPSLPSPNEIHFLFDIFYPLGLFGFCIFWSVFLVSLVRCWKAVKLTKFTQGNYQDIFLAIICINLMFIGNIIHYSPIGLSSSFIIAIIPLFAVYANTLIRDSKAKAIYEE